MLAIGLKERDVPFHIYESSCSFNEIGAGISFGPNALVALNLLSPTLFRILQQKATVNQDPSAKDVCLSVRRRAGDGSIAGEYLFDIASDEKLALRTGMPTRVCVERPRFLAAMTQLLSPDSVTFGKRLVSIDDSRLENITLSFSDDTSVVVKAAISCDGIESTTRRYMHGTSAEPSFSGEYVYRAVVPRESFQSIFSIGTVDVDTCQLFISPGGFIMMYPIGDGNINVVASKTQEQHTWIHNHWNVPSTQNDMHRDLDHWPPEFVSLLANHAMTVKWALCYNLHDRPYYQDRVCLLGDAAHNMTPHLGAGAGMAIEDAYIISCLLSDCGDGDIRKVFAAYDHVRRPRSQRVVELSRRAGSVYVEGQSAQQDMQERLMAIFDELWDYDLEEALSEARGVVKTGGGVSR